ncbi:hypothetical protein Taro_026226 [Colocasia esculenta]|uniref:PPC domain-containing protein n=1 Tax=Colocasia esculenta TaxID=4460 RepID=A0A843VAW0_COLES|nr:hypothetical protein [Colocasia esculenta]
MECYSDEVNSRSDDAGAGDTGQRQPKRQRKSKAKAAAQPPSVKTTGAASGEVDGSTAGDVKRPRGRPPGSKNKPKPPVVNIRDAEDAPSPAAMRPHVLEVTDGRDVVDALSRFSRRHNLGLCLLAGTGLVANVILRQPLASATPAPGSADLSFPGHFEILSISGTFLPPSSTTSPPSVLPEGSGAISVSLAGPHGRVFGGLMAGPLTAVGTVTILAAAFCNATYHRLPAEDDVSVSVSVSVSGGGDVEATRADASQAPRHQRPQYNTSSRHHQQHHRGQLEQRSASPPSSSSAAAGAAQNNHCHPAAALGAPTAAEVCALSMYSCHLPSDVIWAPAARSPPF